MPWQLREAGAIDELKGAISGLELMRHFVESEYELIGYWLLAGGNREMVRCYDERIAAMASMNMSVDYESNCLMHIGDLLLSCIMDSGG